MSYGAAGTRGPYVGRDKQPCCGREQPWHREGGEGMSEDYLPCNVPGCREPACTTGPEFVDGLVVAWDITPLCDKHRTTTPRQLRDSANSPWEDEA
jgi:hypothetical protein